MQEREDTIMDKEKRIYDLKKKNQELEKFKFVLDYKIVELHKQVEPRKQDIIKLNEQLKVTLSFTLVHFLFWNLLLTHRRLQSYTNFRIWQMSCANTIKTTACWTISIRT